MSGEISVVKGVHADILESFSDYRLMKETHRQSRRKRKIFAFIRDVMRELFDLMTREDINGIQRNVHKLASNQDTLMHVVEESICELNTSIIAIKENRQKLNDLSLLIGSVEDNLLIFQTN